MVPFPRKDHSCKPGNKGRKTRFGQEPSKTNDQTPSPLLLERSIIVIILSLDAQTQKNSIGKAVLTVYLFWIKVVTPEIYLEVRFTSDLNRVSQRHLQRDSGSWATKLYLAINKFPNILTERRHPSASWSSLVPSSNALHWLLNIAGSWRWCQALFNSRRSHWYLAIVPSTKAYFSLGTLAWKGKAVEQKATYLLLHLNPGTYLLAMARSRKNKCHLREELCHLICYLLQQNNGSLRGRQGWMDCTRLQCIKLLAIFINSRVYIQKYL